MKRLPILELDRRFPGLGRQIDESMAVAIDGEIFQDAYLAQPKPDSGINLIPKIAAAEQFDRKTTKTVIAFAKYPATAIEFIVISIG